jgi:hypothetical protein
MSEKPRDGVPQSITYLARAKHILQEKRALLKIEVAIGADGEQVKSETEIITGPNEHLYISADIPVNSVNQLTIDESSNTLVPEQTPKEIMLGVNFMIGDILSDRQNRSKHLVIKLMFEFSDAPLDMLGFGIGYRFPQKFELMGFHLDAFSPFVAVVWNKEAGMNSAGNLEEDRDYNSDLRVGISFNLDKAFSWVKKD